MKILLVANTAWYLYNFRSALIDDIKKRGWEPVLVSPPDRYAAELEQAGIRTIPWDLGRKTVAPWTEMGSIRRLTEIYTREKPDLVHHHTMKAVIYGSLAAQKTGVRVVNSIPGRGYVFSSRDIKAAMLRPVVVALLRYAFRKGLEQRVIFENRDDLKFFITKRLVPSRVTILIPSVGVDTRRFHPTPLPKGEFTVGFVGRMLRDKGVEVFVNAAKILQKEGVKARMVLIGEPDHGNVTSVSVEELQEWNRIENVEWWGWIENMQEAYSKIHALAQPTSYGEGVPTTLVEAAAVKRAVIASDWPGCHEIIIDDETGLLIPPKDPAALAAAVKRLIADPVDFDRLRNNVHALAVSKFSTADVNAKTLEVYEQVLSSQSEYRD